MDKEGRKEGRIPCSVCVGKRVDMSMDWMNGKVSSMHTVIRATDFQGKAWPMQSGFLKESHLPSLPTYLPTYLIPEPHPNPNDTLT